MTVARKELYDTFRPWLDPRGYNPADRRAAVEALCDRLGLPASEAPPAPPVIPPAPSPVQATYDRDKLYAELIRDEGLRLTVYRCTERKLTIGIGRNLDGNPLSAEEERYLGKSQAEVIRTGITRDQAFWLKQREVEKGERALDRHLPWWRRLDDVRQRVLLNMWFNLGTASLLGFRRTLRLIETGHYRTAAAGMLASKWARQVGGRALRLSSMMKTGRA